MHLLSMCWLLIAGPWISKVASPEQLSAESHSLTIKKGERERWKVFLFLAITLADEKKMRLSKDSCKKNKKDKLKKKKERKEKNQGHTHINGWFLKNIKFKGNYGKHKIKNWKEKQVIV